jgi:hypothetical protein
MEISYGVSSKKLKSELLYHLPIPLLSIYQRNVTQDTTEIIAYHVYCSPIHNRQAMESALTPSTDEILKKM